MDLREFVKETLVQCAQGVKDSQGEVAALGGIVAPGKIGPSKLPTSISFDIAVAAESTDGREAKLKVAAWKVFGGEMSSDRGTREQRTSRIEFSVPIHLPAGS